MVTTQPLGPKWPDCGFKVVDMAATTVPEPAACRLIPLRLQTTECKSNIF